MVSTKQICETSKWFQSLLPASKILAFNDWTRPKNKHQAVKPANQMGPTSCNTYTLTPVLSHCFRGVNLDLSHKQ